MSTLPSLTTVRDFIRDPAPMWRWTIVMPEGISAITRSHYAITEGYTNYDSTGFLNTPTVPIGRAHNVQIAGITLDTDERFGAAHKKHYPRFLQTEALTIAFYEDSNYNTMKYLRSWREMVVDKNHNFYPSNYYKKSIQFFAFNIKSNDTPTFIIESKGAFPLDPGNGLQYELTTSGIVVVPCTFAVDDVEMHWNFSAEQPS